VLNILLGVSGVFLGLQFQVLGVLPGGLAVRFFLPLLPFAGFLLTPLRKLSFHQPIQLMRGYGANDLADAKVFVANRLSVWIL
jgi:hypothetical protein